MKKYEQEHKKLALILENAYKEEIKKQGLIDTGSLYNTFTVSVDLTRDGSVYKIVANDYFEELDAEYNITENVVQSLEYKRFEEGTTELYTFILTDSLGL